MNKRKKGMNGRKKSKAIKVKVFTEVTQERNLKNNTLNNNLGRDGR